MTTLLASTRIEDLLDGVRYLVRRLARKDYLGVVDFLAPGRNGVVDITATQLQGAVEQYCALADRAVHGGFKEVCDLHAADPAQENFVLYCNSGGASIVLEYDLPIDGEWSDLTLKLAVVPFEGGHAFAFVDLRML